VAVYIWEHPYWRHCRHMEVIVGSFGARGVVGCVQGSRFVRGNAGVPGVVRSTRCARLNNLRARSLVDMAGGWRRTPKLVMSPVEFHVAGAEHSPCWLLEPDVTPSEAAPRKEAHRSCYGRSHHSCGDRKRAAPAGCETASCVVRTRP